MISISLKMEGVEAIYGEIADMPSPSDTLIILHDPHLQNGKDVPFLKHEPRRVVIPVHRILYIEILDEEDDVDTRPWRGD